jgi:hypothetical protein
MPKKQTTTKEPLWGNKNPILWILSVLLLLIIAIAFIIPANAINGSASNAALGSYKGEDIIYTRGSFMDAQVRRLQTQPNIDAYRLWFTAFNETVLHLARLDDADSVGMDFTDEQKVELLRSEGSPWVQNGEIVVDFDRMDSQELINMENLYFEQIRSQQVLADRYLNVHANKAEVEFLQDMNEKIKIEYVAFTAENTPDSVFIEYAIANPAPFQQIDLSRITLANRRTATELLAELKSNPELFADKAKELSQDGFGANGGEVGLITRFNLKSDLGLEEEVDTFFTLPEGSLSEVLEIGTGDTRRYVILKVNTAATDPKYDSVDMLAVIKGYINTLDYSAISEYLQSQSEQLQEEAAASSFSIAAAGLGVELKESNPFALNYGNSFFLDRISSQDPALNAVSNSQTALGELAALQPGEIKTIQVDRGTLLVARLVEFEADDAVLPVESYINYFTELDSREGILSSDLVQNNVIPWLQGE